MTQILIFIFSFWQKTVCHSSYCLFFRPGHSHYTPWWHHIFSIVNPRHPTPHNNPKPKYATPPYFGTAYKRSVYLLDNSWLDQLNICQLSKVIYFAKSLPDFFFILKVLHSHYLFPGVCLHTSGIDWYLQLCLNIYAKMHFLHN